MMWASLRATCPSSLRSPEPLRVSAHSGDGQAQGERLTEGQRKVLDFLLAAADEVGLARASMVDIARGSGVAGGGIAGYIYALECKDYLRCVHRGNSTSKGVYRVYSLGNADGPSAPYNSRPTRRSMFCQEYEYHPWSEARRERARAGSRERLGIPPGHVRIYGVHVPEEHASPLRDYASWMKQARGLNAAIAFVRKVEAKGWKFKKPTPKVYKISDPGYVYKPWPSTIKRRRDWLAQAGVISPAWRLVYGIPVPDGYDKVIRPHADKAAYRRGKTAGAWVVLDAAGKGWPDMPPPARGAVVDLELVEMLLSEHATVSEAAEFLGVSQRYLETKLRAHRAANG